MYPGQFLLTWSLVPWTLSDQDHSGKSSDQTTLSLDKVEQETTGLRYLIFADTLIPMAVDWEFALPINFVLLPKY